MALSEELRSHIRIPFERWKNVFREVFKRKGISPDMLERPAIRNAIDHTADLLSDAAAPALEAAIVPEAKKRTLRDDIFVFSGFKTYHTLREASTLLTDKNGEIKPFNAFLRDVQSIHEKYNRNYLEAEYLFATQSARMAARWEEDSRDADRYDLQYRTAGDDKVRISHQPLDGITLPAADPFWQEYYPPNGWRCRCTVAKVRRGKYERTDTNRALMAGHNATEGKLEMFRFNPGKQSAIFPPHHPYYGRQGYGHCTIGDNGQLAANVADNEVCRVYRTLIAQNKLQYDKEGYTTIPTSRGKVRLHKDVQKNERDKNINTAVYLSEKFSFSIDLLPHGIQNGVKTADAYNHSLSREEEYKNVKKTTKNAIEMALKDGHKQADNIVLWVDSDVPEKLIREVANNRFNRHKNLREIRVVWSGEREIVLTPSD